MLKQWPPHPQPLWQDLCSPLLPLLASTQLIMLRRALKASTGRLLLPQTPTGLSIRASFSVSSSTLRTPTINATSPSSLWRLMLESSLSISEPSLVPPQLILCPALVTPLLMLSESKNGTTSQVFGSRWSREPKSSLPSSSISMSKYTVTNIQLSDKIICLFSEKRSWAKVFLKIIKTSHKLFIIFG